ncbi:Hypothetical protein CINCED_3A009141 [Cinara cedri]|uniref:Uncharacterized protein n=1 Tax=Cinara cedri TaxID=506608 RepID=A0A5E4NNX7_9HEMI|nr:Hypothetical protein CINCED_3A009141 [Cinara cedri]
MRIHDLIHTQGVQKWEIRSNNYHFINISCTLYKRENVVQFVRSRRRERMGHVQRADGKLMIGNHKRRNGRDENTGETAPKMDGQCAGDHDRTYAIKKNKLEHIRGKREEQNGKN